ncbi:hypothetical protein [Atlantibacter hermannii]|uniref:hypothetical protein n=1 Tax=Atlantibacter hermannii TaxID=565 RepID=UPI003076558B
MTINERVSPETLDKIIEAADEVITALAGTNEDVHKNDSAKMCQLWDDLNDRYATPAIVKALATEIKQCRAAAEPMYQAKFSLGWRDVTKAQYDDNASHGAPVRIVYAAPQVTSVPDDAFERALSVLNDTLDDCGDSERGLLLALDRMGIEVAGAAPAEQAEQLSGNTEQVSQPVLPATQFKPVADLYGIADPGGRSTSYSTDAAEASDCRVMGWDVQEFVKLERLQEAITGNSPAIPDGWLAEAERLAEMYGTSFVVFRHGEEAQCADPTKVIISFTDEGLGHHSAAPKQEAREVKK